MHLGILFELKHYLSRNIWHEPKLAPLEPHQILREGRKVARATRAQPLLELTCDVPQEGRAGRARGQKSFQKRFASDLTQRAEQPWKGVAERLRESPAYHSPIAQPPPRITVEEIEICRLGGGSDANVTKV
jgi:hypothetical protein